MQDNNPPLHQRTKPNAVKTREQISVDLATCLLSVGVLMEPIYVFDSGLPQPSDLFFVLSFACFTPCLCKYLQAGDESFLLSLSLLVFWVFTVTGIWAAMLSNPPGLIHAAYFAYNSVLCVELVILCERWPDRVRYIAASSSVALMGMALLGALTWGSSERFTGTADNPNQLAFWSLNAFAFVLYASLKLEMNRIWTGAAGLGVGVIATLTVSRAAAAALIAFLVGYVLVTEARRLLLVALVAIAMSASFVFASDFWHYRIYERGGSLETRGYSRILENPEYIMFGASAIQPERFGSRAEIHSTFGNIMFSYGMVGLVLFALTLVLAVRGEPLRGGVFLIPVIVYGLSHNGIRATSFWLLLGSLAVFSGDKTGNMIRRTHKS